MVEGQGCAHSGFALGTIMPYPLYLSHEDPFLVDFLYGARYNGQLRTRLSGDATSRLKPVIKAVDRFHFIATLSSERITV